MTPASPGLRLVGEAADTIVSRLADRAGDGRAPRYRVEGRTIVSVHTGRRQEPPRAREALGFQIEGVLATTHDDLVEADLAMICDLIRSIRQAERNDPTPPAAAGRVAA